MSEEKWIAEIIEIEATGPSRWSLHIPRHCGKTRLLMALLKHFKDRDVQVITPSRRSEMPYKEAGAAHFKPGEASECSILLIDDADNIRSIPSDDVLDRYGLVVVTSSTKPLENSDWSVRSFDCGAEPLAGVLRI